jgi:hypothetical protein
MELTEAELQEGLWYPNPADKTIFLSESLLEYHPNRVRILDQSGREVARQLIVGNSIDLNLQSALYTAEFYRDEIYIVRLQLVITD